MEIQELIDLFNDYEDTELSHVLIWISLGVLKIEFKDGPLKGKTLSLADYGYQVE